MNRLGTARALCAAALCLVLAPPLHAQPASPAASAPPVSAPTGTPTQHTDALRLLRSWLDAQQAYDHLPSLTAAVVIGPNTVWRGAWGHADHAGRVPARSDTLYSICSISKLFTSVAVMQLAEDGKLSLDDDVGKWLPAFAMRRTDPDSGPISLRALLSHSAGLPREGAYAYWSAPDFKFPTRAELLQGVASQNTYLRAADRFQYSNLGMALLGQVVAAASGQPYEDYVQAHILGPLKLQDTRPVMPAALWGRQLAQGYGAIQRDGTRQPVPLFDARGLTPAAGFSSSVEDLARFASWNFHLLKTGGKDVLRVATLREMQRVQWTDADGKNSWGLGFGVGRDGAKTVVGHTGVCPGYLSAVSMVPADELAVVAMSNANENQSLGRYTTAMRRLMLKGLKLPVATAMGPTSGAALEAYAGRYATQPWGSESVVQPWGADLVSLDLPSRDPAGEFEVLRHVKGDTFKAVREDGSLAQELTFVRDASGRVTGVWQWNQWSPRLSP